MAYKFHLDLNGLLMEQIEPRTCKNAHGTRPSQNSSVAIGECRVQLLISFPDRRPAKIVPKRSAGRKKGSRRSVSIVPTRELRRDAGPTAVARPVKKAPAEGQ